VRHAGSAKQCVWLGSTRYFCGCWRRIANTDTDGNSHLDANSHGNSNCYSNSNCNSNGDRYCDGIAHSHAAPDANGQTGAISTPASHTSAATIVHSAIYDL